MQESRVNDLLKVIIDTNILISGVLVKYVNPAIILKAWKRTRKFQLFVSHEIIQEILRVMRRLNVPENIVADWNKVLTTDAVIVSPAKKIHVVKNDPSDNKFLECAIEAKADYIVTGDKHLKEVDRFEGLKIVNPKKFLDILTRHEED